MVYIYGIYINIYTYMVYIYGVYIYIWCIYIYGIYIYIVIVNASDIKYGLYIYIVYNGTVIRVRIGISEGMEM